MNKLTLKNKILLLIACTSLAFIFCALFLLQYIVKIWTHDEMQNFASNNISITSSIAAQFYERYGDIQAIATNGNLLSNNTDIRNNTLNSYVALYGIYDLFILVDLNGNVVATSNVDFSGKTLDTSKIMKKNFANTEWFIRVKNNNYTEDKDKGLAGTYVEDTQIDPITSEVYGQKMLGTSFTTAVKSPNGNVIGIISARANFAWVENEFVNLYKRIQDSGKKNIQLSLVNKKGEIIIDVSPKTLDLKKEYQRNLDSLLKEKIDHFTDAISKEIESGSSNIIITNHKETKEDIILAYSPVSNKKFIDSIGWKTVFITSEEEVLGSVIRARNIFLIIFLCIGFLGLFFGYRVAITLDKKFGKIAASINLEADTITNSAKQVALASGNLASSTQEQASAVQETVSAIDEVSAMVAKSADNAAESLKVSNASKETAERGKEAIDAMLVSMDEIQDSNTAIMHQIEMSNQQITSIVNLINEIGQKTKVINDIVFQTKLLSFNASVEAARAGEHGKGFAVVAEEVGSLAQMSGNAAKEITQMLENSIHKVNQISEETKSKVTTLMQQNKEKVSAGSNNAKKSAEILEKIVENVNRVGIMANEIAQASKEQSQGVNEITNAMNQLGTISQENASSSQQSSAASEHLLVQADKLRSIVHLLLHEVTGSSNLTANEFRQSGTISEFNEKTNLSKNPAGTVIELKRASATPTMIKNKKELKVVGGTPIPTADDPRFEEV